MNGELSRLLEGGRTERELIGLITAACGGLSAADLAELISEDDLSPVRVQALLTTVAGRSFMPLPSRWRPDTGPEVYILGHDELQAAAEASLGVKGIGHYQDRLRAWADDYRDRDGRRKHRRPFWRATSGWCSPRATCPAWWNWRPTCGDSHACSRSPAATASP